MSIEYRFDDLQDPGVDLAFRLGSMPDDRLVGRHLGEMDRVLVCNAAYAQSITLDTPGDLARANALQFPDNDFDGEWTLHGIHNPESIEKVGTQGTFAVRSFEALAAAAAAGLGVARVPRFVAAARLAEGSLVEALHGWRPSPIPVYLAYRTGVTRIGRVRAVLDAAMSLIPPMLMDSNT
jgi:DNA-binding transcriptional LysR family regulator